MKEKRKVKKLSLKQIVDIRFWNRAGVSINELALAYDLSYAKTRSVIKKIQYKDEYIDEIVEMRFLLWLNGRNENEVKMLFNMFRKRPFNLKNIDNNNEY